MANLQSLLPSHALALLNARRIQSTASYDVLEIQQQRYYVFLNPSNEYFFIQHSTLERYSLLELYLLHTPLLNAEVITSGLESDASTGFSLNVRLRISYEEALAEIADLKPVDTASYDLFPNLGHYIEDVKEFKNKIFLRDGQLSLCLHFKKQLKNIVSVCPALRYVSESKSGYWNSNPSGSEKQAFISCDPLLMLTHFQNQYPSDYISFVTHLDPDRSTLLKIFSLIEKFTLTSLVIPLSQSLLSGIYALKLIAFQASVQSNIQYSVEGDHLSSQIVFRYSMPITAYKALVEVQHNADLDQELRDQTQHKAPLEEIFKFLSFQMETVKLKDKAFIFYTCANKIEHLSTLVRWLCAKHQLPVKLYSYHENL